MQLIYNIDKEKENLYNLYDCFETQSDFSCKVLYKKNGDFFDEMDETESIKKLTEIKDKFQQYCENIRIEETKTAKSVFERHFHRIIKGIISINDFSYDGLIKHLKNKQLGDITFFYSNIMVFLCEILFHKPNKKTMKNVLELLHQKIKLTKLIIIIFVIIISLIVIIFVIIKIKKHYKQILLLKYAFQITEMHID